MSPVGWLVAYLLRWFPHSVPTGLRKVGNPGPISPVLVTANFSLTVHRLLRGVAGHDLWMLVANSNGINVWCAADGGLFTEQRIIDAIKVSGLPDRVSHREIILPPLAAPGVDCGAIREETGFHVRFGPVRAEDIPAYLAAGKRKTEAMRRFRFDLRHRLDMLVSMNFVLYLPIAVALACFRPQLVAGFTAVFWCMTAALYLFVPVIPGRYGWSQALFLATAAVAAWAGLDWLRTGAPLLHWGWFTAAYAVCIVAGFDLAGIATGRKSDPEQLLLRLGIRSLGSFFSEKDHGEITLDRERCRGCRSCFEICPTAVYGALDADRKTTFADHDACFACSACVKQCPEHALSLT